MKIRIWHRYIHIYADKRLRRITSNRSRSLRIRIEFRSIIREDDPRNLILKKHVTTSHEYFISFVTLISPRLSIRNNDMK